MVRQKLLTWYEQHGRHDLPWRRTRDPYKVLVSELMLQQTQVSRVIPKYEAFIGRWPSFEELASADRKDVLEVWQGLGYNSRAVRLHTLAKLVVEEHDGKLPTEREALLKLPGIGPYTAGAVLIFAHDEQSESVDVNVERVVKRLFWAKDEKPGDIEGKAKELLGKRPHDVQSALMDLGSSICTARDPSCDDCPLQPDCKSRGVRPDEKKSRKTERFRHSNRWWRGRILKAVLDGKGTKDEIFSAIASDDEEKFAKALSSLLDDGVIRKKDGTIRA